MQEQIKTKWSLVQNGKLDLDGIKVGLQVCMPSIESLLMSYHFKSRGRVHLVKVVESSIELISESMAKFMVSYAVGQFNACADVDFIERASMEMLLDIDETNSEAVITGEYIPERDPDEL